jgi:asparagine synthetase B (glutamine-hydrolysing)
MSALACILDRRGAPVDTRRVERLGAALADYGDDSSMVCAGPVGIVVRHAKSRRARHCHGPIRDERSGLVVAVAGRFSLVGGAGLPSPDATGDPAQEGCASWALKRWLRDGPSWLDEIAGSFTLVVADPAAGWLSIARDHLGDLKVYYHLGEGRLIAATEAGAILADESVSAQPDEHSAAGFLGFRFEHSDRSFFRGISELAPAHRLRVSGERDVIERYWRFQHSTNTAPVDEVRAAFLDLIRQSLQHHLDGLPHDRIGLSLSGGLDSTALAALAPRGIRAYSWSFEATPDPAERANIEAVSRHLALPVRWIDGDAHGPLSGDFRSAFVHANSPYINAFAALKQQLYATARGDGCRRMMVGDAGDVLYGASDLWLRDALTGRQPWALSSLAGTLGQAWRGDLLCRAALRRLVPFRGVGRALLGRRKPPWLTAEGVSLLPAERLSPILPEGAAGGRYDLSVGARNIELESEERRLFFRCGLERADPFWHRPLLEFVLALPAYRLHRDGRGKVLTRDAMERLLPARVLESGRVGLLGDVFLRGINEHRRALSEWVFERPRSDWQRYVRRDWLEPYLATGAAISFGHTILWRTISYELWFRRVWASDSEEWD